MKIDHCALPLTGTGSNLASFSILEQNFRITGPLDELEPFCILLKKYSLLDKTNF